MSYVYSDVLIPEFWMLRCNYKMYILTDTVQSQSNPIEDRKVRATSNKWHRLSKSSQIIAPLISSLVTSTK